LARWPAHRAELMWMGRTLLRRKRVMSGVLKTEAMSWALVILPVVVQSAVRNSYALWESRAGAEGRVIGWCGSQCVATTAIVFLFFTLPFPSRSVLVSFSVPSRSSLFRFPHLSHSFLLLFPFLSASMPCPFLFLSFPFSFFSFSFLFPATSRRQGGTWSVRGKYQL